MGPSGSKEVSGVRVGRGMVVPKVHRGLLVLVLVEQGRADQQIIQVGLLLHDVAVDGHLELVLGVGAKHDDRRGSWSRPQAEKLAPLLVRIFKVLVGCQSKPLRSTQPKDASTRLAPVSRMAFLVCRTGPWLVARKVMLEGVGPAGKE